MIILYIALSYFLGLNAYKIAIPLYIFIGVCFIMLSIFRLRKKSILIIGVYSLSLLFATIYNFAEPKAESYFGIVVDSSENYYLFQSGIHRFYVYEQDNDKQFGDFVEINASAKPLSFVTYESQFDFKEYLANRGVNYELSSYNSKVVFALPLRVKKVKDRFLSHFDDNTRFLIDAFLFSNKDYNSSVIKNADSLNLIFLFSMTGIYFSFLLRGVGKILTLVFRKKIASDLVSLVVFVPLYLFVFPKISIIRVTLLHILKVINEHVLKNKFNSIYLTSFLMLVLMLFNHAYAYQMGFYLPFFISYFIYYSGDLIYRFRKKWRSIITKLLIFAFMFPVASYLNGSFHPFSLIYQTVLIPINLVFVTLSLISFYVIPIPIMNYFGLAYSKTFELLSTADVSLSMGDFGPIFILLYYVLLILILYSIENIRKRLKIICLSLLSAIFLLSFIPLRNVFLNAIYFINVGQGDATLIQNKHYAVLIDTGGNLKFDMAKETLIPFFNKRQIYKLDALITTHNDFDHNGAASSLLKNFKVDNYLYNKEQFPYQIGDLNFENLNTFSRREDNENSLVFKLTFMKKKFLLMGDASISVEKFLIDKNFDLDSDVLKVGHHGSKTSTCEEFLKRVTPKEAIISCGAKNIYHHPNKEVIDLLNKYNVQIRRTDYEGTITYQQFCL